MLDLNRRINNLKNIVQTCQEGDSEITHVNISVDDLDMLLERSDNFDTLKKANFDKLGCSGCNKEEK